MKAKKNNVYIITSGSAIRTSKWVWCTQSINQLTHKTQTDFVVILRKNCVFYLNFQLFETPFAERRGTNLYLRTLDGST